MSLSRIVLFFGQERIKKEGFRCWQISAKGNSKLAANG